MVKTPTIHEELFNTHIVGSQVLITPEELKAQLPQTDAMEKRVLKFRQEVENILDGKDHRKFIVVGPCSIHNTDSAIEYAKKLKELSDRVSDKFLIIMRVYFEKPRTTVGWKGLINDPYMDDSCNMAEGLYRARDLLLKITELGLPTGTEALDPIVPQYISELITWSAIGARTIESQTHREMASGLSMPVGFKNGTNGSIEVAINAIESARKPHRFLGINNGGQISVFETTGNDHSHIILRGGGGHTNYDSTNIKMVEDKLKKAGLPSNITIDCSHGNSNKDHHQQKNVFAEVTHQIINGNKSIVGMMLESNLFEGNQSIPENLADLKYGVSVTDKCLGWDDTAQIILTAYQRLK